MKRYLPLLALGIACTTLHQPPDLTPEHQARVARMRIAEDRIAWIHDTLPIVRFDPPYVYHMFKAQMEACAGVTKPGFPVLYMAPVSPLANHALAVFVSKTNTVIFALGSEVMVWVIRHELLHWLLAPRDTKDHPPEYFSTDPTVGRCAAFLRQEG